MLNVIKTVHTFVSNAATSSSVILAKTGFGLILIPFYNGTTCGLTLTKKVSIEKFLNR